MYDSETDPLAPTSGPTVAEPDPWSPPSKPTDERLADRRPTRRIVAIVTVAVIGVVALLVGTGSTEPHPLTVGTWDVVFFDEFRGDELDEDTWTTCYWWDDDGCTIASNDELEWYQPDNVTLSDGELRLTARAEDVSAPDGREFPYTSGMVTSGRDADDLEEDPGFAFTYGYAEARVRLPAGPGLWPAFWLLAADHESRPEIDIMEADGSEPSSYGTYVHVEGPDGEDLDKGTRHSTADLTADWHVFGVLWEDDQLIWYLDDSEAYRIEQDVPDEPMYLILNLAVGGEYVGDPGESTEFPATFAVDWVRVSQRQP
jgi:beta-glucanase (GH16 family)